MPQEVEERLELVNGLIQTKQIITDVKNIFDYCPEYHEYIKLQLVIKIYQNPFAESAELF